MESFYEIAFPDVSFNFEGDTIINCPFPHKTTSGETYYESNPSMSIDVEKGIFHCFSCGAKGNELTFIEKYMGLNTTNALKLKEILSNANETTIDWESTAKQRLFSNPDKVEMIKEKYHFNDKVIQQLNLGLEGPGRGIAFPVFLFDKLVDVISYNPRNVPKYRKRKNSQNGIIMPYDTWIEDKKNTVIVAGQKDLGIALSYGINAITITGGEGEIPELFLNDFKERNVYIVFDNDDRGIEGSIKLATALKPYAKRIKIIDISETCKEKGEDLWDYFTKYNKTKKDLAKLIQDAPLFTETDYQKEVEKRYPTVSLATAFSKGYFNKTLRSEIQVAATADTKFLMATSAIGEKIYTYPDEKDAKMKKGDKMYWNYVPKNAKQLFYLIDGNLKEENIKSNIRSYMKYPFEKGIAIRLTSQEAVFKCTVTDYFEYTTLEDSNTVEEFTAYSIGKKLETGKKYKITYKLVPHPTQGNAMYMIVYDAVDGQDSVSTFKINEKVQTNLRKFQVPLTKSLQETIDNHINKAKGLVRADYNPTLMKLIDFSAHSVLQFDLGIRKKVRGYLDMGIVAESRTGKSSTAEAYQKTYGLGTRVPLNGSNATVAGIIGGSHKVRNTYQTRAGILPRSHKGWIIFEELQKFKGNLLEELTEQRSSQTVSINRVSGTVNLPAYTRPLFLTNTKSSGKMSRAISSYPNGIEIIIDLVGTAEDIARFDIIAVLPDKGANYIDPYYQPPEPFTTEEYRDRIRWIWSRKSHQVIISPEVYAHAVSKSNIINKEFNSYIKLFGTEGWLKILRFATSIAGYVCSATNDFENILVLKEHVDYAAKFMVDLYDNPTFRFRQFVEEERKYITVDSKGISLLEKLWIESSATLMHLENASRTQIRNIEAVSGIDRNELNRMLNRLSTGYFIRFDRNDILPTEKFRRSMEKIDRTKKGVIVSL